MRFIVFVFLLFPFAAYAQITVDSLFQLARYNAFNGKRGEARTICKQIIERSPGYIDARVLWGRTYSWDGKYDSAKIILKEAIEHNPKNYDAIDASIDAEHWSDDYKMAITKCDYGLSVFPKDENFMIKKAKMLGNLYKFKEAIAVVDSILVNVPNSDPAKKLKNSLRLEKAQNKMSASYTIDRFEGNSPAPWHWSYLQYGRRTIIGSVIARVNMAYRFESLGWQYEMDAYPSINKYGYVYLNAGFSKASIFPGFRCGGEYYRNLPHAFEASAGFRYLKFSNSDVLIYTPFVGKYIGNYWLSLRSYITPSSAGTSISGAFLVRRYFSTVENYISFQVGYGNSPDDSKVVQRLDMNRRLKSQKIRMAYNFKIHDFWICNTGLALESEEYQASTFRKIYTFDLSIARLF